MALSRAQQSPLIQSSHLRKFTTYIFIKIHAFLPDRNEWKFGKSPALNVTASEKKILDTYQKWTGSIPDQDLSIIQVFMEICHFLAVLLTNQQTRMALSGGHTSAKAQHFPFCTCSQIWSTKMLY